MCAAMLTTLAVLLLSAEPPKPMIAQDAATQFVTALKAHKYDDATNKCDATMKAALQAHPLKETWEGFEKEVGPLDAFGPPKLEAKDAFQVATFEADFKNARRQLHVSVNSVGEISGLFWGASKSSLEAHVRKLVDQLSKGDFDGAEKGFGPKLSRALPKDKLTAAWKQVVSQAGDFAASGAVSFEQAGPEYTVTYLDCRFAKTPLRVKAAFDLR